MFTLNHRLCRLFILCFFPLCTWGASKTPPIQIQSDTASFEQKTHQAIHEGNVILTQGSYELHSDKLTFKKEEKGQLITATGNPATFTGKLDSDPIPLYATAKTIYYYPDNKLIILEGAATLKHEQDTFQGPTLSYQMDKQIISAVQKEHERPLVIFHPKQQP